ncbi:MAG TPA: TspO/MBR family protein [Patescibacteria group bacterium]|nr:TspO/MBR family protein [Patescibacteria group bacterium]
MKKGKEGKFHLGLLTLCFVLVILVAVLGYFFTNTNVNSAWYDAIKPDLAPPSFVFPIVWSFLFFTMALSLYLCLNKKENERMVLIAFSVNFLLNVVWSFLFFYLKNPVAAFFELILLWISIIFMIFVAYRTNKIAAYILLPYFFWVAFAGALNYISAFLIIVV